MAVPAHGSKITIGPIPGLFGGSPFECTVADWLLTFVGPNGSGKTQVLKAMRDQLRHQYHGLAVRYVSAGRTAPMEEYRSNVDGRGMREPKTYLGGSYMLPNRKNSESVMGDFVALKQRADLRLKVQSRLQTLFGREIELTWANEGVEIEFLHPATGRSAYPGSQEASGLVQLVSLLAALYDNEVQCVLIDEPEVSLHPQLQSFLLSEIQSAAGDPASGKKLIVVSTHSPSMLRLSKLEDLTSIVFFHDAAAPPTQISASAPELENSALKGLIARMGMAHRLAFFSPVVVLVEGSSDEIIMNALASRLGISPGAAGVQILPVTGKGEIPSVAKLFRLMGASVFTLSDLDGFTDDVALVNLALASDEANAQARKQGHSSLQDFVRKVKTQIDAELMKGWAEISNLAGNTLTGSTETSRQMTCRHGAGPP